MLSLATSCIYQEAPRHVYQEACLTEAGGPRGIPLSFHPSVPLICLPRYTIPL